MKEDLTGYTQDTYLTISPDDYQVDFQGLALEVNDAISEAGSQGWKGVYANMESTMDPYEDYLGPVEITIVGYRKPTEKEAAVKTNQQVITALSQEMGVSYHDASIVLRLKESGKL